MLPRSRTFLVTCASPRRVVAAAAVALTLMITAPADAQGPEAARRHRDREPIVFTLDVAEDLAGKFVPTFVKPEHSQPERGSFFVTEGRIFPAGTIQGDGRLSIPIVAGTSACGSAGVRIWCQPPTFPRRRSG